MWQGCFWTLVRSPLQAWCFMRLFFLYLQPVAAARERHLELNTVSSHTEEWTSMVTTLPVSGSIVVVGYVRRFPLLQFSLEGGKLQKLRQVYHGCGQGELNKIWLHFHMGRMMAEFYSTAESFTETGRRVKVPVPVLDVQYLPAPYQALVVCDSMPSVVTAVSCATGKQLWQLKGRVERKRLGRCRTTFHPHLQLLLVADKENHRILVLNPETGHLVQAISQDQHLSFCWSKGRLLIVHCGLSSNVLISHVELTEKG